MFSVFAFKIGFRHIHAHTQEQERLYMHTDTQRVWLSLALVWVWKREEKLPATSMCVHKAYHAMLYCIYLQRTQYQIHHTVIRCLNDILIKWSGITLYFITVRNASE